MIIKNFKELSKNPKKKTALQILEAGLDAPLFNIPCIPIWKIR